MMHLINFLREHKKATSIFLGSLLIMLGVLIFLVWNFSRVAKTEVIPNATKTLSTNFLTSLFHDELIPQIRASKLDGEIIPAQTDERVVAVMIENLPASRPQMLGLTDASIVYEALAEGGITRFLALFTYPDLLKVGPVRSARPYFLEWAEEYGGAYVHAGGSEEALQELTSTTLFDLDEDGVLLFRDANFPKPHNLFLDLAGLKKTLAKKNWSDALRTSRFDFSGHDPVGAMTTSAISLNFSTESYRVDYRYDPIREDYIRALAGIPHVTADGQTVRPKNILIQFTEYTTIDDAGRLNLRTNGTGIAWYFSGGKFWQGTWSKLGTAPTQFLDASGKSVSLNPGQTFIEILDIPERVIKTL